MEKETAVYGWSIALAVLGVFLFLLLAFCLHRGKRRRKARQLYELEKQYQMLKSYDVYAGIFLRNARAFQALIGIEREYRDDRRFMQRLQTEYVSLLSMKNLTPEGFVVSVPTVSVDRQAFIRRKAALEPGELRKEIQRTREGIRERENRQAFRQVLEQTGALLYRIARESDRIDQAAKIRGDIRSISGALCDAGIYPMFYEDFRQNPKRQQEFETGSPYATGYPGLYEKQGENYILLQECWGIRKGERA